MAAVVDGPLAVIVGTPDDARARADTKVLLGLAGAALAIGSAMVLALALPGAAAMSPVGAAALFAILLLLIVAGFFAVVTFNAVVALRTTDRQGVGQHRGGAPTAP